MSVGRGGFSKELTTYIFHHNLFSILGDLDEWGLPEELTTGPEDMVQTHVIWQLN